VCCLSLFKVATSNSPEHSYYDDVTMAANSEHYADVEKDHANSGAVNGKYDLHHDHHDEDTALKRLRTAGSLSISPELFEKIYLSPKNQVSNNIRSTFGNPTTL
jgi:uncharacterized protein